MCSTCGCGVGEGGATILKPGEFANAGEFHLAEEHHVTNWTSREMARMIQRRDPTRMENCRREMSTVIGLCSHAPGLRALIELR